MCTHTHMDKHTYLSLNILYIKGQSVFKLTFRGDSGLVKLSYFGGKKPLMHDCFLLNSSN